eukprot:1641489-Pyramimonas_sp.AAC.1
MGPSLSSRESVPLGIRDAREEYSAILRRPGRYQSLQTRSSVLIELGGFRGMPNDFLILFLVPSGSNLGHILLKG